MKRVISLILVAVMLVGAAVLVPSATATNAEHTLDRYNVGAIARYFGGTVNYQFNEDLGGDTPECTEDPYELRGGDSSKGTITIDGNIEDGEWGSPMFTISSDYAPNNGGRQYGTNPDFEYPSAENTYYYYNLNSKKQSLNPEGMEYTFYMMWDEDYLYVAAFVYDENGFNNAQKGENLWNGDALQIRVDTKGPNSVSGGTGYDAVGNQANAHNLDTYVVPWADTEYNDKRQLVHDRVCNLILGFSTGELGSIAYDASLRYDPEIDTQYTNINGVIEPITRYNKKDLCEFVYDGEGQGIYCTTSWEYASDSGNAVNTCYEAAIPWQHIDEAYAPFAGSELGVSTVLLNAKPGLDGFVSFLAWGTGICGYPMMHDPQTCGGSNSVILSDEPYTTPGCDHDFAAATCTAPETCTKCGYQRGYKTGHTYDFSDTSCFVAPTEDTDGYIICTCKVCNESEIKTISAAEDRVYYDFRTTDSAVTDQGFDHFATAWYMTTETEIDKDTGLDTGKHIGPKLEYDDNGTTRVKNAYDNRTFPEIGAVIDLYSNGSSYNSGVASDVTNVFQAGTYFETSGHKDTYTYKADMMFPTLEDIDTSTYLSGVRNWTGYGSKYGFTECGLVKVEDQFYFAIFNQKYGMETYNNKEEFEANALAYVPATAKDLQTNVWHTYAFAKDDATGTIALAWDGQIKVVASDYRIPELQSDHTTHSFLRRFNTGLYLKDIEVGGLGLFASYLSAASSYKVTVNGVAEEYSVGETVEITAPAGTSNKLRFDCWTGDVDLITDVEEATITFKMPDHDVTLEAEYFIIGDINNDKAVNGKDSLEMKKILLSMSAPVKQADIDANNSYNGKDSLCLKKILMDKFNYDTLQ